MERYESWSWFDLDDIVGLFLNRWSKLLSSWVSVSKATFTISAHTSPSLARPSSTCRPDVKFCVDSALLHSQPSASRLARQHTESAQCTQPDVWMLESLLINLITSNPKPSSFPRYQSVPIRDSISSTPIPRHTHPFRRIALHAIVPIPSHPKNATLLQSDFVISVK